MADYGANVAMNTAAAAPSGFSIGWLIGGALVAALVGLVVYFVVGRADTKPIKQGFYGGPIAGTSSFPCSRMSSEAEELVAMFSSRQLSVGEEGREDLESLKMCLAKMCCFKQDVMSPAQTLMAAKELGFSTHMDIQPVADLTARCFSKTIPERDLSIQFMKWRDYGYDMIRRLCTAGGLSEAEVKRAEKLFAASWKDVENVAQTQCLGSPPDGMYKRGAHDPAANTPEAVTTLREYDGYY